MPPSPDAIAVSNAIAQHADAETLAVEFLAEHAGPKHWDVGPGGETLVVRPGWGPLDTWSDYLWISYPGS